MSDDLDEIIKQVMQECVSSGRKPSGYWKDIDNVKQALDIIIAEVGKFPTAEEIRERNSGLLGGIKYHGGLLQLRKIYGKTQRQKGRGYWKDIENVKKELNLIIAELGRFPIHKEIRTKNPGLASGIAKYHNGLTGIKEVYQEDLGRRPSGYWENFENVKLELDLIIDKLERFPTHEEIADMNPALPRGLKHHGGLNEIRKVYGEKALQRPTHYWEDIINVKNELEPLIAKLKRFPTAKEMRTLNPGLDRGIQYHGGLNVIRKLYGEKPLQRKPGYWQNIENVRGVLEPLIEELGRFPVTREISEVNSSLPALICKYHGGLNVIKIKLGYADQELGILQELMEGLKDE